MTTNFDDFDNIHESMRDYYQHKTLPGHWKYYYDVFLNVKKEFEEYDKNLSHLLPEEDALSELVSHGLISRDIYNEFIEFRHTQKLYERIEQILVASFPDHEDKHIGYGLAFLTMVIDHNLKTFEEFMIYWDIWTMGEFRWKFLEICKRLHGTYHPEKKDTFI